jgi:hypothetical protein
MDFYKKNWVKKTSLDCLNNTTKYKNVLLIDSNVKDPQLFLSFVNECTFPIIYSSTYTKTKLLELLKTTLFSSIERIGIVFTSNLGSINQFLDCKPFFINNETSTSYSENVEFIISIIKEFKVKNIDYLACNTLNYSNWTNYYDIITKETGVIVGASNNKTGNIKYGGDWIMESTMQDIEFIYFTKSIQYYSYLLDNSYITWVSDLTTPFCPAISGQYMYVANNIGSISKINLANPQIIDENWIPQGSGLNSLTGLVINGQDMYVANTKYNTISKINLANAQITNLTWIPQGSGLNNPIALVINGSYMYVSNFGNGTISQINLANAQITTWASGLNGPSGLVINGSYMYVANYGNGTISQINLTTGSIINQNWTTGLNTPLGLVIYEGYIYVNEIVQDIISQVSLGNGSIVNKNWATGLNDPVFSVINNKNMYVTNVCSGTIVRFDLPETPTSNICFPAGTPINTDQGIIAIEMINPNIHTIEQKTIVDITKTITPEKHLIEFKKNALGLNYPTENTIMSQEHKVYHQGQMREAKTFLGKSEKVVKIKYNGEILYNVLMEDYSQILVNNLICETLHPDNIIAKLYTKKFKYTDDVRDEIFAVLIECLDKKKYKNYTKIMKRYCN